MNVEQNENQTLIMPVPYIRVAGTLKAPRRASGHTRHPAHSCLSLTPLTPLTAVTASPMAFRRRASLLPRTPSRRRSSTGTVCSQEIHASVITHVRKDKDRRELCLHVRTSYGYAVFEACWAGRRNILAPFNEVGLQHDSQDHVGGVSRF